jgi:tetratricopeptide (TPR) repeat protein
VADERTPGPSPARRAPDVFVDASVADFGRYAPASTAAKLERRFAEAAQAFMADRFADARRLLRSIDQLAPGVPEVHELLGLTAYRLGRWREAVAHLEQFITLSGGDTVEQHPVLADCYRALGQHQRVDELWRELGAASPAPDLLEEGRIVLAGSLVDQGRLVEAIRQLEKAPAPRARPSVHHLRRFYVLADLYERSGELPRARRLFEDIVGVEPRFADAVERRAALG